jgi:hypothetical protein
MVTILNLFSRVFKPDSLEMIIWNTIIFSVNIIELIYVPYSIAFVSDEE